MLLLTLIRHNMVFISIIIVLEFHFTNKWSWHRKKFRRTAIIIKKYINNFMSFSLLCPLDPLKKQKMFHTNKKFCQLKIFFFDDQKIWKVACCGGWLVLDMLSIVQSCDVQDVQYRPRFKSRLWIPFIYTVVLDFDMMSS